MLFRKISNSNKSKKSYIGYFTRFINSSIGDYSYTSHFCVIRNTSIGKFTSIGEGVKIGLGTHPTNFFSTSPIFYSKFSVFKNSWIKSSVYEARKKVIIGNDVHIGANVFIMDGVKIDDGSIIGAGSIVTKDVEKYSIQVGMPAKQIKKRFSEEIINELNAIKLWDYDSQIILKLTNLLNKELNLEVINKIKQKLSEL